MVMSEQEALDPGPVPNGETPVADNPCFVGACMSVVSDHAAAYDWRLKNSKLTHSEVWGFVWRIDFLTRDQDPNSKFVARMVCWSARKDATVMGTATYFAQQLEPF